MVDECLTYEELVAQGWRLVEGKGVSTATFTSLSFRLDRGGRPIKHVQGYGKSYQAALDDAVSEANAWLKAEQIVELHRRPAGSTHRRP